ncbi:E3 ubiquitin-protein ligase TRIM39-like [Hyla sarda]|uniref:E3 ubiquitin-protein ligase TRIM39-like n=1 Tax=Hyla sarda TaxID=327740 RepID=UPI0024C41659|nr:E3 ubiquitin-protein ligase TRIM39-like [Hyla sarda]
MASDQMDECLDPTRLRCGHNYGKSIDDVLDTLEGSRDYTCPECGEKLHGGPERSEIRPVIGDNNIFCTDCTFSPLPAVISCLNCDASLCDKHLRVHSKSEEHVFTKLNFMCSTHKKPVAFYCSKDAACICVTCALSEEHEGHEVEPLTEASDKRKEKLRNVVEELDRNKKATEERVEDLQKYLRTAQEKVSGITESVVALFRDTRKQLDALEHKILEDIANQEKRARASVCQVIHELEMKIDNLSRDIKDIEELCTMAQPLPVLQRWETVRHDTGDIKEAVKEDRSDVDIGLISVTVHTALSDVVTNVKRAFYVQQTPDIVLNVNTASNDLHITADLKSASGSEFKQNCPKLPERFQHNQVLGIRSFCSGRHFLEVETCPAGNWRLGMSYPSIARKGYHSLIGHSNKSWGLCRYLNQYFVIHDRHVIPVGHKPLSQRLGIFLDYEAGRLSFYELCDPIRHLHTYTATFTEALYLILGVYAGWLRIRN